MNVEAKGGGPAAAGASPAGEGASAAGAAAGADAEPEGGAPTEAHAEAEAGAPTRAHAEPETGSEADAASAGGRGREAGAEADAGPGAEPEADAGPGAEPDADARSGAEPDADARSGAEPDADAEPGTGIDDGFAKGAVSAPGPDGEPRKVSRRFPLFTRDTARPEGGGRAASGDAPAPARQWPLLGVVSLVGVGLLLTAFDVFRVGTLLIGLALLAGAVMRWWLPGVGMLAVRSRFTDMVTYGSLGLVIVLLAMMAQPDPWLEIPFLDDTLHFTISS
ncbi:hypothetical protein GCM10010252_07450 [Streptomyces aureoverticillatus]|nr:hypothetical protein GCM10010252_07450 [Streptomyces aureoverticillatus]